MFYTPWSSQLALGIGLITFVKDVPTGVFWVLVAGLSRCCWCRWNLDMPVTTTPRHELISLSYPAVLISSSLVLPAQVPLRTSLSPAQPLWLCHFLTYPMLCKKPWWWLGVLVNPKGYTAEEGGGHRATVQLGQSRTTDVFIRYHLQHEHLVFLTVNAPNARGIGLSGIVQAGFLCQRTFSREDGMSWKASTERTQTTHKHE